MLHNGHNGYNGDGEGGEYHLFCQKHTPRSAVMRRYAAVMQPLCRR